MAERKKTPEVEAPEVESEDIPELTDEELAEMRPASEAHPDLVAEYRRGRGPQIAPTKRQVTLRLDADLLEALRAQGKGWQTRVNEMLRKDVFGA